MRKWLGANPMFIVLVPLVMLIITLHYTAPAVLQYWNISRPTALTAAPEHIRQRLLQRYEELGITGNEKGTLAALSLGWRDELDKDIKTSFARSGAMHVLAVSGLHVGLIYFILLRLLILVGIGQPLYEERIRWCLRGAIVLLVLWLYALITGFSPSVVRATIMLSLVEIMHILHRRPLSANIVAAAAVFILAFQPLDLFSVSFQLSFAAVSGILLFLPFIERALPVHRIPAQWLRTIVLYVRDLVGVSIAAQMATLPITLYYFGLASTWFLLTNIIILPLAALVLWGAIGIWTIGWWTPIGLALAWLTDKLVWAMNTWTSWVENLPGAFLQTHVSLSASIMLAACFLCGAISLYNSKLWWMLPSVICIILFGFLHYAGI